MKDMIRKESLRGVAMAMEVCALLDRWGIGWSIKGTAKRLLNPPGHGVVRT